MFSFPFPHQCKGGDQGLPPLWPDSDIFGAPPQFAPASVVPRKFYSIRSNPTHFAHTIATGEFMAEQFAAEQLPINVQPVITPQGTSSTHVISKLSTHLDTSEALAALAALPLESKISLLESLVAASMSTPHPSVQSAGSQTPAEPSLPTKPNITQLKEFDPIAHIILVRASDTLLEEIFRERHGAYYDVEDHHAYTALAREVLEETFNIHLNIEQHNPAQLPRQGASQLVYFLMSLPTSHPSIHSGSNRRLGTWTRYVNRNMPLHFNRCQRGYQLSVPSARTKRFDSRNRVKLCRVRGIVKKVTSFSPWMRMESHRATTSSCTVRNDLITTGASYIPWPFPPRYVLTYCVTLS
jgi:hypothetical protein